MKILIIGYGSIGERHATVLHELGHEIHVISQREDIPYPVCHSLNELKNLHHFEYIVISNATPQHYTTFLHLQSEGYQGTILIEKPIFASLPTSTMSHASSRVGYNLRFHPVIQELKNRLYQNKILCLHVYVGSYLPNWRPARDYRLCESSSASSAEGGGVLYELSHELDYVLWLTGIWQTVSALGGHISPLEIQGTDAYALMLQTERCPLVTIQMNYLDHQTRREIICVTENMSMKADLVNNTLTIGQEVLSFPVQRNDTYRFMHQAILEGQESSVCSFQEGLAILELIEKAQLSMREGKRIINGVQ
ncbi:MAG: Gfo/Idh/MocA family oxidoreductase [SAR324 cluster bacterium]|nr:Gfo/Idh/MocA family oxidoreductase [SAR324 cluster bacterium]